MEWLGDAHELWCIWIFFFLYFKLDFFFFFSDLQSEQTAIYSLLREHFMYFLCASCFGKTVRYGN